MTKRLHFHFSLSCIGEGNGNPLQCSCLENPRDGGASWAAVYGVAQSWTRLKRLSSSSSSVAEVLKHSQVRVDSDTESELDKHKQEGMEEGTIFRERRQRRARHRDQAYIIWGTSTLVWLECRYKVGSGEEGRG